MKFADLHIHTDFSDGDLSPQEIVKKAQAVDLCCIAITDHDTTEAIDIAKNEAGQALEVIPGVELTADFHDQEVHILGYLLDYKNEAFQDRLQVIQKNRIKRIYGMCAKLKKLGVNLEPEEVLAFAGRGTVGRLHVARLMLEKGYISSIPEAFNRYIGNRSVAYVGRFKMTPKEAIGWIVKLGGIAVLAHPYALSSHALISDFVKIGIKGIEVYYPEHRDYQTQEFMNIAAVYHLIVTGGSDYHGEIKKNVHLGSVKLPYEYVEKLKEAQCQSM